MRNKLFKIYLHFSFLFCISVFLFCILANEVNAESASFYLSPSTGTFFVEGSFDISVFVNTEGNSINAVQVDLEFPPDKLQVTSPTSGSSFISVWADQPFFSNKEGLISFKGGVLAPGINTTAGLVSTITFRAKSPGMATISFLDSSKALLADGEGTNILKSTMVGEYILILPPPEGPRVSSSTHPSLTTWYRDNNPIFSWEKVAGVTDFSFSLTQDPTEIPDNISEGDQTSTAFTEVENGIWYFHIKAQKYGVWGKATHYPVHIDATPPREFKIDIKTINELTGSTFFAYFSTDDLLSGIDYYGLSLVDTRDPQASANPFFVETISPYKIPYESTGKYIVLVRAYDRAGNYTEEDSILTIVSPFISYTETGIQIKSLLLPWWLVYSILFLIGIFICFGAHFLLGRRNLARRLKKEIAEAEKEIDDVKKLEKKIKETRARQIKALETDAEKQEERLIDKLFRTKRDDND